MCAFRPEGPSEKRKRNTTIIVDTLRRMKTAGKRILMLTTYGSSSAALMDKAGIGVLLVGGPSGTIVQGHKSTLPVSLRDMCYHTENITHGTRNMMIVADLPFGVYRQSREQAFAASAELMAAGAHTVKLENGVWMAGTTELLQIRDIPIYAHIDLTSQSVFTFGDYKVQGRDNKAEALLRDAETHDATGAAIVLMEYVPTTLAKQIAGAVGYSTIGIGAGADCDGQVLATHDMLGVFPGKITKFVKNFIAGWSSTQEAVGVYIAEVKAKAFPTVEHIFEE